MSKYEDHIRELAELCREYKVTIGNGGVAELLEFLFLAERVAGTAHQMADGDAAKEAAYLQQAVDAMLDRSAKDQIVN